MYKEKRVIMSETFKFVLLFALSAMVVNTIGILVMCRNQEWAMRNKEYFMCFAAGMLITSPLIVAFPEAAGKTEYAGLAALAGFMFMYFSNKGIKKITSSKEMAFGATALAGIGIHSLMDGIIYSVTFSASVATGVLAGIGLVAHEFAEGVITFSLLIKAGVSRKKAGIAAFFVAALTTPIGALLSYPLVQLWTDSSTGLALGFIVGVLIYTSASHLLPEVEDSGKEHSHFSMLAGVALAITLMLIGGH